MTPITSACLEEAINLAECPPHCSHTHTDTHILPWHMGHGSSSTVLHTSVVVFNEAMSHVVCVCSGMCSPLEERLLLIERQSKPQTAQRRLLSLHQWLETGPTHHPLLQRCTNTYSHTVLAQLFSSSLGSPNYVRKAIEKFSDVAFLEILLFPQF